MSANYIGQLIGGFIAVLLLSRIFWLTAKRWPNSIGKAAVLDGLTGLVAALAYAIGGADGGPPNFLDGFGIYPPCAALVFVLDAIRLKRKPATPT
jgi:hypothetical protein